PRRLAVHAALNHAAGNAGGEHAGTGQETRTMTAKIIDGVAIARKIRAEIKARAKALTARTGVTPGLAVIIAGDNPASEVYVRNKIRACEEAGIHSRGVRFPNDVTEEQILSSIDLLNRDPDIHGILVQLPLPAHIPV